MGFGSGVRLRPFAFLIFFLLFLLFSVFPSIVDARLPPAQAPLVVWEDRGGTLLDRVRQIRQIKSAKRRVEIRGAFCHSSCTMLLGLPDVCVSADTVFGFHGPSAFGTPLPQQQFDRASHFIAAHYPEPLQGWYLSDARHDLVGLHMRTGLDLIALGVPQCAPVVR